MRQLSRVSKLAVPRLTGLRSAELQSRRFANLVSGKNSPVSNLQLSYTEGPTSHPLLQKTFPDYFKSEILPRYADSTALISRHEPTARLGGPPQRSSSSHVHWTFEELDERVAALSRGLLKIGITKGDRVAVIMGNNSPYALLQWACARIGAVLVTVNPAYRINEIIRTLNAVNVKALVVVPQLRSSRYVDLILSALPSLASPSREIDDPALPSLRNLIVVNNGLNYEADIKKVKMAIPFNDLLLWNDPETHTKLGRLEGILDPHDVINLQFTSGTTGLPKAVSLTHHNLLNNGWLIGECMRLTNKDRAMFLPYSIALISPVPQIIGAPVLTSRRLIRLILGNLAAWVHGSSIVYAKELYCPESILQALYEEKCTAVHGVPTHFLGLLSALEKDRAAGNVRDFSNLRTGIASGSPVPIDLMRQLIDKLNLRDLTIAYGMTETSPVSFQTTPEDPLIKRTETVGKVQPHVKAKIVDPEGRTLPIGQPGELCVSGYNIFKGYWEDEEQTSRVVQVEDGGKWMHTGDTAILDAEGYLKIVGRIKDIIIRGGENLFPVQIENALTTHPSVHEAAVVSVPDPFYGEVVGAWIGRQKETPSISREELRAWVAKEMNPQNAPAWVFFLGEEGFEAELPKTASGKIQKNILREWSKTWAGRGIGKVNVAGSRSPSC